MLKKTRYTLIIYLQHFLVKNNCLLVQIIFYFIIFQVTMDAYCFKSTAISDGLDDWFYMPELVLINIFKYLSLKELINASKVCKHWNRVSKDEYLWKRLFYLNYDIYDNVGILPGPAFIIIIIIARMNSL